MLKSISKSRHKSRQAFTLVELIIVLVILAIIAAATIPALTGYIKKAKREKYVDTVHYALEASQAVMTELYGAGDGYTPTYLDANSVVIKNNVNWLNGTNQIWGDRVLALMDRERDVNDPYVFIFGVGRSEDECKMSFGQQYTVYYVAYIEDSDSPAVFYINGEWMYEYPRNTNNKGTIIANHKFGSNTYRNTIVKNGANIPLQFYVVSNHSSHTPVETAFWTGNSDSLLSHSQGMAK